MTSNPQDQRSATAERARAAALWARDTGLGGFGFALVLTVALSGWSASFLGLHGFGMDHMGLGRDAGWLVPLTFDGAPAGLSIVVMRASTHGRSAILWRLLIIGFTGLSSWINYEHIQDPLGRVVASFMPPAAVILFEGLMSEAREAAQRRNGRGRATIHPLRWFFDRKGTLDLHRRHILGLPVPTELAAASATASRRPAATPEAATATPPSASAASHPVLPVPAPKAASATTAASPASASPRLPVAAPAASASHESVYLPAPATATPTGSAKAATPGTATPAATASPAPASKPAASSSEQRDLDDIARVFRELQSRLGKSPSDKALADELGVGRSRAQQLRIAAIEAGHDDLAKPLRAAS